MRRMGRRILNFLPGKKKEKGLNGLTHEEMKMKNDIMTQLAKINVVGNKRKKYY